MHPPVDTALLLRIHAEHRWLQEELMTVLDQLDDAASMRAGELKAALAYLEVTWGEELRRAEQTDAAFHRLERQSPAELDSSPLTRHARGYYSWVRNFRRTLAERVEPYVGGDGAIADPS
jgi:hypothetical protein